MKIDTDTVALVTGASRGLGYMVARELARKGAHVLAVARTVGGLEELADEIDVFRGAVTLVPMDITDDDALAHMCRSIFDRWARLDLLVHCAAHAAPLSPVAHISEKDLDRCWQVNARAVQRIATMTEPLLKTANGTAVFMKDNHIGPKFFGAYGCSKLAGTNIAESWAAETRDLSINVINYAPNPMPTALRARFYPGENKDGLSSPIDEAIRIIDSVI